MLVRPDALLTERTTRTIKVGGASGLAVQRYETTSFGEEVGKDPIEWWINRKESELPTFKLAVLKALKSAQLLKEASQKIKKFDAETYEDVVRAILGFAKDHICELQDLNCCLPDHYSRLIAGGQQTLRTVRCPRT